MAAQRFGSCFSFSTGSFWEVESGELVWVSQVKFLDQWCLPSIFCHGTFDIKGQDDVSKMRIVMNQSLGYRILEDPMGILIDSKNQALINQALERYEELVRLVTGVEQTLENARKGVPWARSCSPGPTN